MLADELLAEEGYSAPHRQMLEQARNAVTHAVRFTLDREVVVAAQLVTEARPSSLIQGLPLCRLPYPTTWFEYAGRDRPGSCAVGTIVPHRVGLLCDAAPEAPNEVTVNVFWHNGGRTDHVEHCPVALLADLTTDGQLSRHPILGRQKRGTTAEGLKQALLATSHDHNRKLAADQREVEAALALSNRIFFVKSRYFAPLAAEIVARRGAGALEWLLRQSQGNVEGEASLLLGILMLLNTRNGTSRQPADLTRLNSVRLKRGRQPLLDHWTVTLRLSKGLSRGMTQSGIPAHEMRAHLVRGHFKIRRSGIYWWSPHVRGKVALGGIRHEYRVKM
jgi:hypothetical protein